MDLLAVLSATWPAAETVRLGPWTLRRGAGGGQRVSAATLDGPLAPLDPAEAAMQAWGQPPIFMIRPGDHALDAILAAAGYVVRDPTVFLQAPAAELAGGASPVIRCEAPLATMREIWTAGGVGRARLAVMARCPSPRIWLLGRMDDRPVACAFVGCHGATAMLHALHVAPAFRRRGLGTTMTRGAAAWAQSVGATTLTLAVTAGNHEARALYGGLGFAEAGGYHYRAAAVAGTALTRATGRVRRPGNAPQESR